MNVLVSAAGANGQPLTLPHVEYSAVLPELVLIGGALFLLLASSIMREYLEVRVCAIYTTLMSIASLGGAYWMWDQLETDHAHSAFSGAIAVDHYSVFFVVTIGIALGLSALVGADWLEEQRQRGPEFFVLAMLSAAGAMFMAAANDLIVVFLGLEILSIALYVLTGFDRTNEGSREGAIKYLILGGFSSAIFLYGIALTYGATGTTNLSAVGRFLSQNVLLDNGLLLGGMALLIVGFGFKVAAVPFHQWTPDVYQGAPTPVTAFMAAAAKAGAFAALLRVFASSLYTLKLDWQPIVLVLAVITLLVGSIVACVQQNVKRMLAYSSISHAGYILLGLQAATLDGIGGSLYYLLAYTFMVVGSFAIVSVVGGQSESRSGLEAFRGLAKRNPGLALTFTVFLLAQAGVPLTAGFLAKFYVISALVENHSYATAVFAMVIAAVAAFFYLRIVIVMYSRQHDEPDVQLADGDVALTAVPSVLLPTATWVSLAIAVVFTIGLGVAPPQIIDAVDFARHATNDLFTSP